LTIDLKNQIFWSSVTKGNKDVLQFMIEQCGMDVEMGDANERTVIEVAAQNGNRDEFLQISIIFLTLGSRPRKLRIVHIPKAIGA
jgi:pyruvate/2-oxoglutarate dehydrogenase complex dihydrolipoamide dehydrogenase (E3) component